MKNLIIAISALLLTIAAIFLLSYNNAEEDVKGRICKLPDAEEQLTFNVMDETLKAAFYIFKFDRNDTTYHESAMSFPNEDLLQFIKGYCLSKNFTFNNELVDVILYYDTLFTPSLCISDEHIRGISLYEVNKNRMTHRLYLRNEKNDFYEEENVNIAVSFISNNHIYFYLENYVFTGLENKSLITITGDIAAKVMENYSRYRVPFRLEREPRADKEENS